MGILSFFSGSPKYFDKKITPKCDYCHFGKRSKDGDKVLCEKIGIADQNYSCNKFIYSPLKRIPVKQLKFVGSIANEDIYMESKSDRDEKEKELAEEKAKKSDDKAKKDAKTAEESKTEDKADIKDEKSDVKAESTENTVKEEKSEENVSAESDNKTENTETEKAENSAE